MLRGLLSRYLSLVSVTVADALIICQTKGKPRVTLADEATIGVLTNRL